MSLSLCLLRYNIVAIHLILRLQFPYTQPLKEGKLK